MILKFISLLNFKNHGNLKVDFINEVNCFLGNNGVGKTNLLDAIYYLSFSKSYYNTLESDNVKNGENFFMIKGSFINESEVDSEVTCSFVNNKKKVKFNNKNYIKLSDHIGKFPSVIITPLDSKLVLGGADERRRFVDKTLSQIDNNYLVNLISYNKILRQRNTLLKKFVINQINNDLLTTYDNKLSELGTKIYLRRKDYTNQLAGDVQKYYDIISQNNEQIQVIYKSELEQFSFFDLLNQNRKKDQVLTYTSSGVHRDDFIFNINSRSLRKSGSQGQQKTFIIALKFAYFDLLKSISNTLPLLLLDDIFDKLDNDRVEQIIKILNHNQFGQIFITDTSFQRIELIMNKVNIQCKYFMFNKKGIYEKKFKN